MSAAKAPINTVVIGYGLAGRGFHSYLVSITPGLRLYGVMVRRPEAQQEVLKDYPSAKIYSSMEEVCADNDVQLVVIGTPNDSHTPYTIQALKAGKHVICDKPFALTVEECDDMIAAAAESKRHLFAFQNRRWDGDFQTVKDLISTEKLGKVKWIEMAYQKFLKPGWRKQSPAVGGGRFWDLGAHLLDQCVQFAILKKLAAGESIGINKGVKRGQYDTHGLVKSIHTRMLFEYEDATDIDSHTLATVELFDGTIVVIDTNTFTTIEKPRFFVVGDKGTFIKHGVDPQEEYMLRREIDNAVEPKELYGTLKTRTGEETIPTLKGRWRNVFENVAAVINGEAEPAIPLWTVRTALCLIRAALDSANKKEVFHFN